ncbi:MAG: hypothetical protein U1A27_12285 [Phycisphaerae bacterium]
MSRFVPFGRFAPRACRIASPLILFGLAAAAAATETTVKNDSFISGGSAVVFGDFDAGEQAGVRLTAPCTGTIVAVQVAWFADNPGELPTFGRAIHIYNGATFPTPGAQLEVIDSPVLTPGALNEYRFLDDQMSIPLSVPVTSGQQFYVSLEFDEPTHVATGGAGLLHDLDGCQANKNVLFSGTWFNFCFILSGDVVIRAVINCPDPTGACCKPDGSCVIATQSACQSMSGTYQGNGTACTGNCPQPTGACCFPATGGCLNLTQANCQGAGGIFHAGTNCGTFVCFPIGACCRPDGSCLTNVSPEFCAAHNGVFQGHGTSCATTNCPPPKGACCFPGGFCLLLSHDECDLAGAEWRGPQTDCADNDFSGVADACEQPPCIPCDTDCNGSVDAADIPGFVHALLTGVPNPCSACNSDVDQDSLLNGRDVSGMVGCLLGAP